MSTTEPTDYRVGLLIGLVVVYTYHKELLYSVKTLWSAFRFLTKRRVIPQVTSCGKIASWDEPPAKLPYEKIIWGFWDGGEEKLPGFCQMAVESWRVRHPHWKIIILSDANFKDYVSPKEVPSTFYSLKPQYRSDVIRIAVLRRYGGIYLDASYTIYRSFDDMWDTAKTRNDVYLTSLVTIDKNFHFPNNCLLIVPNPQNPMLVVWQKLLLQYLERPLDTTYIRDACRHDSFQRVCHHFHDNDLGGHKLIVGYFGVLWTLADVLYYEDSIADYVSKHVYVLPSYRWTFDIVMCTAIHLPDKEALTGFSDDESIRAWLKRLPTGIRMNHRCEPKLADRLLHIMCAMKISSEFCHDFDKTKEFHTTRGSTLSILYQASIDTKLLPIKQADLIGAQTIVTRTSSIMKK